MKPSNLQTWFLNDFRSSGIPDRLTLINAWVVEGDEAIEILTEQAIARVQNVTSYTTRPAASILQRYEFGRAGGWVANGITIDGDMAAVPYFKPIKPRLKQGEFRGFGALPEAKIIKYETPQGCPAAPLLAFVDEQTAQAIYQRYGVTPLEGETFWQVVKRCNLPVVITEGLKKALALIANGIPAIAVRGFTQWRVVGTDELHPAIAQFAGNKRLIYICFDQDEKLKTRQDAKTQIGKLAPALEQAGAKPRVMVWDRHLGKGVDDVMVQQGEAAGEWLNETLHNAISLKDYLRHERIAAALGAIARLNRLTYPIERDTQGDYLPELPDIEPGAIHVVTAQMGSGKTVRIGQDWVKQAIARGWNVLVLCPLNSLGQQTAKDWALPHIHSFGTTADQQTALWAMVSSSHGVVMCPDSLHRLPDWFWQRPTLLVMDEANQVIEHLTTGNTLGSRWADIVERFSEAARHAIATGAIVLSEDGLSNRAVKFAQTITGCNRVRVFRHTKQGSAWDCTVYSGQASGYRVQFLQRAGHGHRLLYVTSSQREAHRIERALLKRCPALKVVRIDSETNEQGAFSDFFESPDRWLQSNQPDILILSPSAKSGVSIEGGVSAENAYFDSVWGYFPALATDTHAQLLGRYRPPVPRFVFVPPFIQAGGDEAMQNPRAIARRLQLNTKGIAGVYGLQTLLEAEDSRAESLVTIETAVLDYLAESKAVTGCQMAIAHDALVNRLESAGHQVRTAKLGKDAQTVELWNGIQEELWREDAQAIAAAKPSPEIDESWAVNTLNSLETSKETRTLAHKVLWRAEFPGVAFDDPEQVYQALCRDWGAMARGVKLQAKAENLEAAKEGDRAAVEAILKSKVRAFHRLPKNYLHSMLIAKTGVLDLLDGRTYTNADPRALAVKKAALHWANEFKYLHRLQIKPDQTPVEICNKLLKKLGLEAQAIARPGKRGQQDRVWSVEQAMNNPVRVQLLEAIRRKLSGSVSTICKDNLPLLQIKDTPPKTAPPALKAGDRVCTLQGYWAVIAAIDGDSALIDGDQVYGWRSIDALSPALELEATA